MRFTKHYLPINRPHAFLSASKPHWTRYDDDKLLRVYMAQMAAQKGTELHDLACRLIKHKQKLPDTTATMNQYVNDAIGFQLTPELVLFWSENCYGTADALGFRRDLLRISDLKTGVTVASFNQLLVYAAMFCLEYRMKPFEIKIELRIYQNNEVKLLVADPDEVTHIMDKIRTFDALINTMREETE
jgi:hypothetical protein